MRKKIVAGNWKMNLLKNEALSLYKSMDALSLKDHQEVHVYAGFLFLDALKAINNKVAIGAQNFFAKAMGAFTGEVSFSQLNDLGVDRVLIGHSERRTLFAENDEVVKQKIDVALEAGFKVMYCCGEPLEMREQGRELHFVYKQLEHNIFHLTAKQIASITIAYEPIWAIGTGKTASVEQAEDMHKNIRKAIEDKYGSEIAESVSILYGGSCNSLNAKELFSCPNIDGGLIGGASLKAEDFLQIIQALP